MCPSSLGFAASLIDERTPRSSINFTISLNPERLKQARQYVERAIKVRDIDSTCLPVCEPLLRLSPSLGVLLCYFSKAAQVWPSVLQCNGLNVLLSSLDPSKGKSSWCMALTL